MSKRVLQISNYMYPHIGGIEQVARDIADCLKENDDIKQKIICFNEDAKDGEYVCKRSETVVNKVDGVDVIRCGCFAKKSSQSLSFTYARELKKVINDFNPNLVILHYPNPFVSFFLLKYLKKNTKFIVYWHLDITKQKVLGKLFHGQNIRLLDRADKIVATSPNYIEGSPYLSKYKEKCTYICNCIRPERFALNSDIKEKIKQIKEENKNKLICFGVGRHIPYKGFTYLVKASKLLDNRFKIYIGGKGPLSDSLKQEAQDDDKIVFLGRVSDEDMIAYYSACDIFTFPSITKNEAFGIALAESMYFGKPAVTFTIKGSGVNYVNLDKVTGIECPNGDVKAYSDALTLLADNKEIREEYGKNAKERVLNNFMYDSFCVHVRKLVDNVFDG